jgi:hypothetical protein
MGASKLEEPESQGAARLWDVSVEGVVSGPHEEEQIVAAIEGGHLLQGLVRPAGESDWAPLKAYPPFAAALRRSASTMAVRVR